MVSDGRAVEPSPPVSARVGSAAGTAAAGVTLVGTAALTRISWDRLLTAMSTYSSDCESMLRLSNCSTGMPPSITTSLKAPAPAVAGRTLTATSLAQAPGVLATTPTVDAPCASTSPTAASRAPVE